MIKKNAILFLIAVIFLTSACNHQASNNKKQIAATDSVQKKSAGKIEFSKEIHNFGTVKDGEVVVFSFQFRNTGETPLHLTNAEAGCGCLSVKYSNEDIASQSGSMIDVIFNSAGEWGNQIKTVKIEASNGETKTLTIGAFVENKNFNIDLNN